MRSVRIVDESEYALNVLKDLRQLPVARGINLGIWGANTAADEAKGLMARRRKYLNISHFVVRGSQLQLFPKYDERDLLIEEDLDIYLVDLRSLTAPSLDSQAVTVMKLVLPLSDW